MHTIATFYRFVQIDDVDSLRATLRARGRELDICGTILLADEGINATIAGEPHRTRRFLDELQMDARFADLCVRYSKSPEQPFQRYKVKRKKEIVTSGVDSIDPVNEVGTYVSPQEWNALIQAEDVVVIDTRNDYEVAIGTFDGAINPGTPTFRDFPAYVNEHLDPEKHRRVAMFCTGGIRCEKATALLRSRGFQEVYHLQGGILNYLESVDPGESLWRGDCFVFDERIAVGHRLNAERYELCVVCQHPVPVSEKGTDVRCASCERSSDR